MVVWAALGMAEGMHGVAEPEMAGPAVIARVGCLGAVAVVSASIAVDGVAVVPAVEAGVDPKEEEAKGDAGM